MGKSRLGFVLSPAAISPRRTPELAELAKHAPSGWRPTLAAAESLAIRFRVRVTAYGALLWQSLLGLDYLHLGSDLDLLWRCSEPVPANLPAAIAAIAARAPMRIDGEVAAGPWAVQWRELLDGLPQEHVLCKSVEGLEMRPAGSFCGTAVP